MHASAPLRAVVAAFRRTVRQKDAAERWMTTLSLRSGPQELLPLPGAL